MQKSIKRVLLIMIGIITLLITDNVYADKVCTYAGAWGTISITKSTDGTITATHGVGNASIPSGYKDPQVEFRIADPVWHINHDTGTGILNGSGDYDWSLYISDTTCPTIYYDETDTKWTSHPIEPYMLYTFSPISSTGFDAITATNNSGKVTNDSGKNENTNSSSGRATNNSTGRNTTSSSNSNSTTTNNNNTTSNSTSTTSGDICIYEGDWGTIRVFKGDRLHTIYYPSTNLKDGFKEYYVQFTDVMTSERFETDANGKKMMEFYLDYFDNTSGFTGIDFSSSKDWANKFGSTNTECPILNYRVYDNTYGMDPTSPDFDGEAHMYYEFAPYSTDSSTNEQYPNMAYEKRYQTQPTVPNCNITATLENNELVYKDAAIDKAINTAHEKLLTNLRSLKDELHNTTDKDAMYILLRGYSINNPSYQPAYSNVIDVNLSSVGGGIKYTQKNIQQYEGKFLYYLTTYYNDIMKILSDYEENNNCKLSNEYHNYYVEQYLKQINDLQQTLTTFKTICDRSLDTMHENGVINDNEFNALSGSLEQVTRNLKEEVKEFSEIVNSWKIIIERDPGTSVCEGILDKELVEIINEILTWVRILVPIIVIALGTIDFSKAVLSAEKDEMHVATKNFTKRLIIAVIIFFIPTLLGLLVDIFNAVSKYPLTDLPDCGIK